MELQLERDQQAHLAAIKATPGFQVILDIMKDICDKFTLNLINTPHDDTAAIVANHGLSKASAQFFTMVVDRINEELMQYSKGTTDTKPVDVTEGLLDLGESVELANVINLGNELDLLEER